MASSNQLGYISRKPHRISVTVPDCTYQQLLQVSDLQGRSASNLAAFLLETGLAALKRKQDRPDSDGFLQRRAS